MPFPRHTAESAPEASRSTVAAIEKKFGYLPAAVATMAHSPQLLQGFVRTNALFDNTTLTDIAREVLVMTVAAHNTCNVCVALHTARLTQIDAPAELIDQLRNRTPLTDTHLEALRVFVLAVLSSAGDVSDSALTRFTDAGYTEQNALEVVLGIGTYTMSTFANRLTKAPVDPELSAYAL